jgi:RNA polymerase sigma-70 factor (ECF subfamily)
MPPHPFFYEGREAMAGLLERAFGGGELEGEWRLVPTAANRMPAAASYLKRTGDSLFRAFKLDVLRVQDGLIAEATTFGPELFGTFGLPGTL